MAKKKLSGEGWTFTPDNLDGKKPEIALLPKDAHQLVVVIEKRKHGKMVTVIRQFFLEKDELKSLAKSLKSSCGAGGRITSDSIELQGDCREQVTQFLLKSGWNVNGKAQK